MLIGELAKLTGLSKDGIRHYEELGLIGSVPRSAGSKTYREYDPLTVDTVEMIRGAQHFLGLPLKEIGPLLKSIADTPPTKEQTVGFLEQRLVVIREKLAKLHEVEDHLVEKVTLLQERY